MVFCGRINTPILKKFVGILLNNDKQTYSCYLSHDEYKILNNNGIFEILELF